MFNFSPSLLGRCNSSLFIFKFSFVENKVSEVFNGVLMYIFHGKPTHALVPCWMPKPLPPRNQCTDQFAPAMKSRVRVHKQLGSVDNDIF